MEILTPFIVTQACIFTSCRSTPIRIGASKLTGTLLYRSPEGDPAASVHVLFPIIIGARFLDQ